MLGLVEKWQSTLFRLQKALNLIEAKVGNNELSCVERDLPACKIEFVSRRLKISHSRIEVRQPAFHPLSVGRNSSADIHLLISPAVIDQDANVKQLRMAGRPL